MSRLAQRDPERSPEPTVRTGPVVVIFDGYCKVCTLAVGFLQRRDKANQLTMLPNQQPDVLQRYGLTKDEVQRAVWALEADGTRYEAAAAITKILATLGGPWALIALLYRVPPLRWLEDAGYRWFSRNRYHFGWLWRTTEFCDRPGANCLPYEAAEALASPAPTPPKVGGDAGSGSVPGT